MSEPCATHVNAPEPPPLETRDGQSGRDHRAFEKVGRDKEGSHRLSPMPVRLASVCQVPRVYICVIHKAAGWQINDRPVAYIN
jgi:hypothetical protein